MSKAKITAKSTWKEVAKFILVIALALVTGAGIDLAIRPTTTEEKIEVEATTTLELAQEQTTATIVDEEGEEVEVDVPKVEAVNTNQSMQECPEGEECGRGWYVDTSTPQAFMDATYGNCIDTDGHYGSQCWDLANLFWQNYAGRTFSTCGTGAAKGSLNCFEYNAGEEFEMVWNPEELQPGDWVIFTNGTFGHVGMATGYYNDGYITLFGTNQGGASCYGGGAAANIINISLKNFGGAFRPKSYIVEEPEEPEPEIPITGCIEWHVAKGDTMSKIMLECEGTIVYGEAMNQYADSWISRIVKPGQSVYEGWQSESHVGLYEKDWIDHETK